MRTKSSGERPEALVLFFVPRMVILILNPMF